MPCSRVLGGLLLLCSIASGCGSDTIAAHAERTAGTTIAPATTAPPPPPSTTTTTTTTTTTVAPDPYETFVANIKPEIERLVAFEEPDGEPAEFEFSITNPTYFGNPLVLMITERSVDGRWLKVQIPVRPNGTEAWIRTEDADITSHRFRAEVNLTERAVTVWEGEELVVETAAVIGRAHTPTPVGRFFVNDLVEKLPTSVYGPYILSLSGFSEALDTFGGGVPVIAIHGTNRPELIGGAHSNGCVRIPNDVVRVLAETVPMGTPVDIVV